MQINDYKRSNVSSGKDLADGLSKTSTENTLPFVSILLAVRNEEKVLANCLNSLSIQNYPLTHYEILVGDDQSTDGTWAILKAFTEQNAIIKPIKIASNFNGLKGKSNVLAQLAQKAKGNIFLFTDADMELPNNWIQTMLSVLQENIGIVNGYTIPKPLGIIGKLQTLDWLIAQKQLKVFETFDIPVTAMGNNMLITKDAYQSVGGYEGIGFSVTEDFQIFTQIVAQSWNFTNAYNTLPPAYTLPERNLSDLITQRLRWMQGALQLPFKLKILLFLNGLFLPLCIILCLFAPFVAITFFILRWITIVLITLTIVLETKQPKLLKCIWFYDFYNLLLSFVLLVVYPFINTIHWKGRKYTKA